MARHFLQRGETDSARIYAEEVLAVTGPEGENLDYCVNYDDITALCRDYLRSIGDSARAEIFAELHHQFTSRTSEETSLFIAVANMFKQNELEMAHLDFDSERKQAERQRAWWVGISAGLLMLAVAALMIIRVKRRRKRRDDARIAQEERQRAESLLHEMSCGETETDDWAKFSVLFSNAHPGFIAGLESRYPALTKGDVKMACYTLAGLETKQIARLMNINPASVMKTGTVFAQNWA